MRAKLIAYASGVAAVILVTALIALVPAEVRSANVSILYLPAVLAVAVRFGRGPAIMASVGAFLLFDFFFLDPRYQFTVGRPDEWVALVLLLFAAAVTGQLAADQRARAQEAEEREREAMVLYDVVRLMGESDLERALRAVAERLRLELSLAGVALELDQELGPRRIAAGDEDALRALRDTFASHVLARGRAPTATERGGSSRWVRVIPPTVTHRANLAVEPRSIPVLASGARIATLLLLARPQQRFSPAEDRLLLAAADQLGIAIERNRLRREASEADALRRTDELKSALLDAVSHDLRTPLASILASASSLRQRDVTWTDAEREEFLAAIEEEARRLDRLVGNLLDLSRVEAGTLRPEKAWYDAGALVDDVLGRLRPLTARHSVAVHVPDDLPPVPLDYVEIDQVLSNLVENAAKYAPPGSEIEVAVHGEDGSVRFEVRDHGPGIPRDAERDLFAPFHRIAKRDVRHPSGVGLGLAVSKRLVEAHGGRIWLEHPDTGGARFVFELPLEAEAAPA
ncbi:MAG: hypothetical protein AUH85_17285 [Chloroflexi bacterium 13_1_40CM_4_68_4]|nr:MAG: hypothetical protein AUH85_17285 [Chloroflexi bacterium 13_1_40CM_4_68_4]